MPERPDATADEEGRQNVVTALIALAASEHPVDRADAGEAAALFIDDPAAADLALRLVLDNHNTYPTLKTSEALVRRADLAAWRLLACAITAADDSQIEWIGDAVHFSALSIFARDRDGALLLCAELAGDEDAAVAAGAAQLVEWLKAIEPVLYSVEHGNTD